MYRFRSQRENCPVFGFGFVYFLFTLKATDEWWWLLLLLQLNAAKPRALTSCVGALARLLVDVVVEARRMEHCSHLRLVQSRSRVRRKSSDRVWPCAVLQLQFDGGSGTDRGWVDPVRGQYGQEKAPTNADTPHQAPIQHKKGTNLSARLGTAHWYIVGLLVRKNFQKSTRIRRMWLNLQWKPFLRTTNTR